jgi:DNA-binding transcriptional LysR family regulator
MFDLKDLRCFKAAYELGGFARAAKALHTVQSNVSARIGRLEQAFGAQLFERRHRRIVPTARAELLYRHAVRVLAEVERLESAVKSRGAA